MSSAKGPFSKARSVGGWEPPSIEALQALLPDYQFVALIGRGGMGAVFKAMQVSLNRPVAIKILPEHLAQEGDATFATRFREEALTMARLTHPGIVGVFAAGEAGGLLYIVMEFVDGADVAKLIEREGKLAPGLALSLLTQVCDALQYAHQNNVVHRDIKPANLLLTRDGVVKVADFGLARRQDEALLNLTRTNVAIGTPDFLAPEAWTAGTKLDGRADLYAVGVTLYQMLTGEVPRGFWEMPSERVGADKRFDAIIERAMQPKPEARYQSSVELRRDLARIQTEPEANNGSPPQSLRTLKPSRLVALAAGLLAIIGLVVAWPIFKMDAPAQPTVRDAARWLVRERAELKVVTERGEFQVKSEQDIPEEDFQIVHLTFDRWKTSPPQAPPPDQEFDVLRAVTTLRSVYMRLPGISDSALGFLTNNSGITALTIGCPDKLTDRVFSYIAGLSQLETLDLSHSPKITGRGIAGSAWLASIQFVDFLYASLDVEALRALAACPHLQDVRLEGTKISRAGLQALVSLRTLKALTICVGPNLSEGDLAEILPQFGALRKLNLVRTNLSEELAHALETLTNLNELLIAGPTVTDALLASLSGLSKLELLSLYATQTTEAGLAAFKATHPNCEIIHLK